ncbi:MULTISPECIES: Rha family transcriptional regulator [Enterobacteriaceae]|uniref:Rha family transcriptional regulator n=1 Tax=Enterobacteriaceae TaxID=543 RepID=UPI00073C8B88|nr:MULTISPECIES: Rha family transcriptional regulator [Enterobacteriaceae]HDS4250589.1 Rha family transcriptional regulator [Enterobacter hormaechei subsp. steigerwaltii]KSZ03892.1 Rha family transcriptional regulator [Enterobacter sp. 50858885]MCC2894881.1 Rha family transcriptional regulator [Enterobacter hormaechei]MCC2906470.1 Rha family transcriptional regulator [Enterobacter hormaechei]MCC2917565.1 Rha family transcriptional regulator [Enterobacter hormaechei]
MSQQEISIINLDQLVSMTSVEIAELTGKEHRNVLRDIRNMAEELNALKTELVGEEVYKDAKGESRVMYRLDRKHTFILVAGYSVHLRAKCYDHIQTLERRVLQLEDQKKRAAIQSANRRGVTWGDYCKTYGLPAQKLMTALLQHRGLFRKNPISNEWSVNPKYSDCFRIIKPSDQKFSAGGYNFRFNAKGLEVFGKPEMVDKMRGILVAFTGTDQQKQEHLLKQAQSGKLEGL